MNGAELDRAIKELNKNNNISDITSANTEGFDLSDTEKDCIKKFKPENIFIVYGTLAPNRPNYSKVEHIKGEWKEGIVRGKLDSKGWGADLGYNGYIPTSTEQEEIKASILFSQEMPANWQMLDDFEGKGYKRILAKYELDNGEIGIGFIYAIDEENQ